MQAHNLRFFIGDRENMGCQKFRLPKSSMRSYFQQKIPQKRSFFEFPQQQHNFLGVMLFKNNIFRGMEQKKRNISIKKTLFYCFRMVQSYSTTSAVSGRWFLRGSIKRAVGVILLAIKGKTRLGCRVRKLAFNINRLWETCIDE